MTYMCSCLNLNFLFIQKRSENDAWRPKISPKSAETFLYIGSVCSNGWLICSLLSALGLLNACFTPVVQMQTYMFCNWLVLDNVCVCMLFFMSWNIAHTGEWFCSCCLQWGCLMHVCTSSAVFIRADISLLFVKFNLFILLVLHPLWSSIWLIEISMHQKHNNPYHSWIFMFESLFSAAKAWKICVCTHPDVLQLFCSWCCVSACYFFKWYQCSMG